MPGEVSSDVVMQPQAPGEEIVITGMSGRFPDSANIPHFKQNLMNKVDMVSDDDRRWKLDHPEIPQRTGKLLDISKFDAEFFQIENEYADTMDPMARIFLEAAVETLFDAGMHPKEVKGTRTAVIVGCCHSESENLCIYTLQTGSGVLGCSRTMMANRVSNWLGLKGPSYAVDTACSSSMMAFEQGYRAIRNGYCDQALIGGANLCLHPFVSLQFSRLGVLNPEGKCRCFDENAAGYARSEGVAFVLLQQAKNAKRIYAHVVHAKSNCDGYKEQGITFPSGKIQAQLMHEVYLESGVDPVNVAFVEAHGTGTKVGDPEEVGALDKVFCTGRKKPLPIGSVKSNIGHGEPVSGVSSIVKVCIAMETGKIPPNINFEKVRSVLTPIVEGRMQVVTEPQDFDGGYVGINSFGFGGANVHVLLKSPEELIARKRAGNNGVDLKIPHLLCVSGRTKTAVDMLLDGIHQESSIVYPESKREKFNTDMVHLLQSVFQDGVERHDYRGFVLLDEQGNELARHDAMVNDVRKKKIVFLFSGNDVNPSLAKGLMVFPVFNKVLKRCESFLEKFHIHLMKIVYEENFAKSFVEKHVASVAVQICIYELLKSLKVVPDLYIGYGSGEILCAYADGCLSMEQTLTAAYSRANILFKHRLPNLHTSVIHQSNLVVKGLLTEGVSIMCHLSTESTLVGGLEKNVKSFLNSLDVKGIEHDGISQESRLPFNNPQFMNNLANDLLKDYSTLMNKMMKRSEKWLSTSLELNNSLHNPQYHVDSLILPVILEKALYQIPRGSYCFEINSYVPEFKGLLEDAVENLNYASLNIKRGVNQQAVVTKFLETLGKLYCVGKTVDINQLYKHEWPVKRGTPMIAHLVGWDHGRDWIVSSCDKLEKLDTGERSVNISANDEETEYIVGHVIDGRNLYPATGYLTLVWETLAMMSGQILTEVPCVFEDVRFLRATNIPKEGEIKFDISIQKGSGKFEVLESGTPIVTGRISQINNKEAILPELPPRLIRDNFAETVPMNSKDIYKELRLRGYNYSGAFKASLLFDHRTYNGKILWANNWVTFMDCMMQLQILCTDTRGLFVPTSIKKLKIDVRSHIQKIHELEEDKAFKVELHPDIGIIRAGGIEICGLNASAIARKKPAGDPVLEKHVFVPNHLKTENVDDAMRCIVQHILENVPVLKVKAFELVHKLPTAPKEEENESAIDYSQVTSQDIPLSPVLCTALEDLPLVQSDMTLLAEVANASDQPTADLGHGIVMLADKKLPDDGKTTLLIGTELLAKKEVVEKSLETLRANGYILSREDASITFDQSTISAVYPNLNLIASYKLPHETLIFLQRKIQRTKPWHVIKIDQNDDKFSWLEELKQQIKIGDSKILLVNEKQDANGVMGLTNCVRKEPGGDIVRMLVINDQSAPAFNLELDLYKNQLELDLVSNVLENNCWGAYRHLQIKDSVVSRGHSFANVLTRGDLSSLKWIEGPLKYASPSTKSNANHLVHVYYSALNFRDIMTATGRLAAEVVSHGRLNQMCVQGLEYAGRTTDGRRVMGLMDSGALATVIDTDPLLSWEVPSHWTLQDAATVPVVYATVYYAFYLFGDIKRGETLLIHAGSGGVGQAAIHVGLHAGCRIITTVGTEEKRKFLLDTFPELDEKDIGNSRDTSFEQLVMRRTGGRGVDIVLNSLAEDKLLASLRCLAPKGRFLEIGKFDLANDNPIGMGTFMNSSSFQGVTLESLFYADVGEKQRLGKMVSDGIRNGAVQPLSRKVFDRDDVEQAFRFMAAGKHIGKVLLKMREEEPKELFIPENKFWPAVPRIYFEASKSYIITGGLGGFGLELADWLALRGARHLVLSSRKGLKNGYQASRVKIWRSYGISVDICTSDVTTRKGVGELLQMASSIAPVAGVFNLAVVLEDAILENQSPEKFQASFGPKAVSTKHLDELTREFCPALKYFVVFSSVSCGRGNAGQCNYGMSNSVMERICENRHKAGLPALAIQWGAVGEVGLVADMQDDHKELEIGGTLQQRISSCLDAMDVLLSQTAPVVASMVVAEKKATGAGGAGGIVPTVLNILGLRDLKTVSPHSSLAELGMDSLMAVEIKQTLEREFEVFLTPQDIRSLTFARLQELATAKENSSDQAAGGVDEKAEAERLRGLLLLLENIAPEEVACIPVIRLDSQCESKEPLVFTVPGVEGGAHVFKDLASRLKARVECLQMTVPQKGSNLREMGEEFLPYILEMHKDKNRPVNIVAYSFGSLPTLEVVAVLEKQGYTVNLILIDGAPAIMKALTDVYITEDSKDETFLQIQVLMAIRKALSPSDVTETQMALLKAQSWDERITIMANSIEANEEQRNKYSKSYVKNLCDAMLIRSRSAKYNDLNRLSDQKIKARVTLLKPSVLSIADAHPNYELDEIMEQNVDVRTVEGNHKTMVNNPLCADIINEVLGFDVKTKVVNGSVTNGTEKSIHDKMTRLQKSEVGI